MNDHLIFLAKSPFNDGVKTRLATSLGSDAARGIYARLLYETLFKLLSPTHPEVNITLSLASSTDSPFFCDAFPEVQITHQCNGNIGDRIQDALQTSFNNGADRAVLIATDVPGISWDIVQRAFDEIDSRTVVFGPSADGGFYLIGMMVPGANFYQAVPWSTTKTLNKTVENIRAQGFCCKFLPELMDVDNQEDWFEWVKHLNHNNNTPNIH